MTLLESKNKLSTGSTAPDFNLKSTGGNSHSLDSFPDAKAFLIIFMCNHCPYVKAKLNELNRISNDLKPDLVVIGINSNESENYSEDSFKSMKHLTENNTIKFLYLHDETQQVAKSYSAACTPDPFLFDENKKLIFHSRIDNPAGLQPAQDHELYDAIKEFLESGKITTKESPSIGCSIKWK